MEEARDTELQNRLGKRHVTTIWMWGYPYLTSFAIARPAG
jgi:hypothetical protein